MSISPRRIVHFLREDLWREDLRRMPRGKRLGIATLRVLSHVVVSFTQNLAGIRAAGLTLITLLSLVPLLALIVAVGNGLGYGADLRQAMLDFGQDLPPSLHDAVIRIHTMVDSVQFTALGVVGTLVLVWTSFALFTRVEQAFNHVWRTKSNRSFLRRVSDFIALIVLVPVLVLGALFLTSWVTDADWIQSLRQQHGWAEALYDAGTGFAPHVLMWIAFIALYKLIPSARVHWRAAVIGGVVAGSLWIVLYGFYLDFQVGVARANAIYATLAALPLLLIYLQLSWTIILAGAEVSYAVQNLQSLRGTEHLPPASHAINLRLAWHLMARASEGFRTGRSGCDLARLAADLDVPREWVDGVFDALWAAGLVVAVRGSDEDIAMPSRPPDGIRFSDVVNAVNGKDVAGFLERVRLPAGGEEELKAAERAEAERLGQGF